MDRERYITAVVAEYNRHHRRIAIEDDAPAFHAFMCNAIQAQVRKSPDDRLKERFEREADGLGE